MVGRRARQPVSLEQLRVKIKSARLRLAAHELQCPLRNRDRRHAGAHRKALLRAAVGVVNAPVGERYFNSTERGDAVGHQEGVVVPHRFAELGKVVAHAGRSFGVDDSHQARLWVRGQCVEQCLVCYGLSPIGLNLDDVGVVAVCDLNETAAEVAVDADDHGRAWLDERSDPCLHPRGAGSADRQSHAVALVALVDPRRHRGEIGQDLVHVRIEVAEQRLAERSQDVGADVCRAGATEQARFNVDGFDRSICHSHTLPVRTNRINS